MPAEQRRPALDARTIHNISMWAEFLRLKHEGDIVEGHGETKGRYIVGAISDIITHLRQYDILLNSADRLEELSERLASRAPRTDGYVVLSPGDEDRYKDIVGAFSTAWNDFVSENNFSDTRPSRGMFDYTKLGQGSGSGVIFQDQELLSRLPTEVKSDIDRAAVALARGVTTGSTLLSLRAGEAMLRVMYKSLLNKEPSPQTGWYVLADEIFPALKILNLETDELEGYVNGLRLTRNRAMHPGTVFKVRDAEDALVAVRQLVVRLDGIRPFHPSPPTKSSGGNSPESS